MASPGIKSLLVVLGLITTGCCQQQIVVPIPIAANQPFTVYCDTSRVALPSGVTGLFRLQIFRNVSAEPSGTRVAYYAAYAPPGSSPSGFNNPQGRDWNFTFSGNTGNSLNMKIEWLVRDTKCEDAGTYRCHVDYYLSGSGDPTAIENSINVTAAAGLSVIDLTVSPDDANRQYYTNQNLTFTCTVQGQNSLMIKWKYGTWTLGSYQEMDIYDNIEPTTTSSPPANSGCPSYGYVSRLNVQLTGNNEQVEYICIVADSSSRELSRENITISIAATASPNTAPAKGGTDVGMIVGIVIGCVALIAIIIIVIVVVRKRSNKEGNYKDNADGTDANRDADLHAPPPVFYPSSKPSKGSKDEDKDIKTQNMRHDIPDDGYGNKRGDGKSRDRAPYYEDNYNYEQEAAAEQTNRKGQRGVPRYDKQSSRGEQHYASTDVSHSGDESAEHSDVPLDGKKSKPRATRRSQVPQRGGKQLHYAELDLPKRMDGSESGSEAGRRRADVPVEYAEIRV